MEPLGPDNQQVPHVQGSHRVLLMAEAECQPAKLRNDEMLETHPQPPTPSSGPPRTPSTIVTEALEQQRQRLEALTSELNGIVACIAANATTACNLAGSIPSGPGVLRTSPSNVSGNPVMLQSIGSDPSMNMMNIVSFPNLEDDMHGRMDVEKEVAEEHFVRATSNNQRTYDHLGITDLMPPERQKLVLRLQARLGFRDGEGVIFAHRVIRSLESLGSEKYTVTEIEEMLVAIGQAFPEGF
eukprot:1118241-Amphidinium_carterae.1